jgi:acetylornithine deacetylase/succinyl-diaminopimelate desuccinylase-like protein
MGLSAHLVDQLRSALQPDRLIDTAIRLIEIPSPTRSAGNVADCLASILAEDGLAVQRPVANWPESPAVVGTFQPGAAGRTIQFQGHLDTVHLPFVAPRVEDGMLYGSGAIDMKGGLAAMCEAVRILRDTDTFATGNVLFTAVDLHEAPWGDMSQLRALIEGGCTGDAALVPEYISDRLPVMGRGMAVCEVRIMRDGEPMHEVMGGIEQPRVIAAGADLINRFEKLDEQLATLRHPLGDRESAFIGQVGSGEIFNQSPTTFKLSGTRRWLHGTDASAVERQYRDMLAVVAKREGISVDGTFQVCGKAFELDQDQDIIRAFQACHRSVCGRDLPPGSKPLIDDGTTLIHAGVPAITHGPCGRGAHTVDEQVPVSELARVALLYALTAICFCGDSKSGA